MARPRRKPIPPQSRRGGQPDNTSRLVHGRRANRIGHRKWFNHLLRRKQLIGFWLLRKLRDLEGDPPPSKNEDRIAKTLESLKRYDPGTRARLDPPAGSG